MPKKPEKMLGKNWREKLALRAAGLMCSSPGMGYEKARQEAVRVLRGGQLPAAQLPTKKEIREKIHLLSKNQQTLLRRFLFEELLVAMQCFADGDPQVDAEWLTAEIVPGTKYVIQIRGPSAERKVEEALPPEIEGMFLLAVRYAKESDAIFCKPHLGIAELKSEMERLGVPSETGGTARTVASEDRCKYFATLLWPLESIMLSSLRHPEGDALYHSLQVFQCALEFRAYDEEFLLAALLHDVGKGIDPEDHVVAGLTAIESHISQRTASLIELHHEAHRYREGTLGMRARRRLEANPDFEDLLLLAECDQRGRECGVMVPDVEQALEQIRDIGEIFSG